MPYLRTLTHVYISNSETLSLSMFRLKGLALPLPNVWSFEASIKSIGTLRSALAYNLLGMDEGFNIHFFKVTFLHQVYFCSIHLTITPPSISNLKTGPIQFNILN